MHCMTAIPSSMNVTFHASPQTRTSFGMQVRLHRCMQVTNVGLVEFTARPRPLSPAGGNTLNDITSPRVHWRRDVPHMPNRLAVK